MSKRTFVGVMVVALAVVVMASGLLASNMGFKLNYQMLQTTAGVSRDGTTTLALPDLRQTGLNTAKNLLDDIGLANVTNIQRFVKSSNGLVAYTGRPLGGTDFSLNAGEGYYLRMKTTVNYIVVGSDDPTLAYNLQQTTAGVSRDGTNFYAYNYHQTAATAKALLDDIGLVNVTNIQRFVKSSNGLVAYTGRPLGGTDFALTPGEAYYIRMKTTVNYVPSHY
ncbi:MAG: hypothetical protein LAO51_20275 [Acidobacteriia bacterium]|nr:hypothetical protein [Terriglobia bacterium]